MEEFRNGSEHLAAARCFYYCGLANRRDRAPRRVPRLDAWDLSATLTPMDRRSRPADDRELLARYRANYSMPAGTDLAAEQAWFHLELEQRLTAELRDSTPETRWATFERCYDELYAGLPWLVEAGGFDDSSRWAKLIGPPPQRVYEVGSGNGQLAHSLASLGYNVTATDVSRQRGGLREDEPNLSWQTTDGVNLDRFARDRPYDAVISDQVIEHLHPDDILIHCRAARDILRGNGRYIVRTPHSATGPHDLSPIYGFDTPVGMHLHEYTNRELGHILREAGFASVAAVATLPDWVPVAGGLTLPSRTQFRYLAAMEAVVRRLAPERAAGLVGRLRGPLMLRIWIVATR